MKKLLELTANEARKYLMRGKQYCTFRLPEYFDFDQLLTYVGSSLGSIDESQCYALDVVKGNGKRVKPSFFDDINYKLFSNKDGKLDYRPFTLVNPYYYYLLVRLITEPDAWKEIQDRFNDLKDPHIAVESLPIVDNNAVDKKTILGWWEHVEQRSIELSLQYKYMFITDITNCYGSIYTHSIAWAMMGKDEAKRQKGNKALLGNKLDEMIQGMQYGQTNGIPQGNVVSDIIAELVLSYADSLISRRALEEGISDYFIIRYRDDYRVFCNSKNQLEELSLVIQRELALLNFKINSSKTSIEEDLVLGSIKADKIALNEMLMHRSPLSDDAFSKNGSLLQKELLAIYSFSKLYPNSGSVEKLLGDVYDSLKKSKIAACRWTVITAILISIARDNPRTYGIIAAIISLYIGRLESGMGKDLIKKVYEKISRWPNTELLMVWLQRIVLNTEQQFVLADTLCRVVTGDNVSLWNNDWLDKQFLAGFSNDLFISKAIINKLKPEIAKDAVSPFYGYMSEEDLPSMTQQDVTAFIPIDTEDVFDGYQGNQH